ncbi:glycogen-binding domain-containing protein [Breznakiella homolactica]|uniref:Isoamylase n=1 Tax=Breznakiella homolactica TaxID=2798577 RepID=A0A7T7XNM7_9SPIR|nr:glycogen-binding domain-containing protein [Breznakiella homolactica]QQO09562.1 glycogen-binding domain-containing protein [Breznakiella homolactica]
MKYFNCLMLLLLIIGNISAVDTESYQFIDHLLSISGPKAPEIYEDAVIFTVPSSYRRVGITFAHEGFSKIYWFRNLMVSGEIPQSGNTETPPKPPRITEVDSGFLFHVFNFPEGLSQLEYRLIINGLWTTDPMNPRTKLDSGTGLTLSVLELPALRKVDSIFDAPPGHLRFIYSAPSGEAVTVAGSFNGWDPFMYELRETSPGYYTLTLPVPPGTYQYVFFHRGRRVPDPGNPNTVFTREGTAASEIRVN